MIMIVALLGSDKSSTSTPLKKDDALVLDVRVVGVLLYRFPVLRGSFLGVLGFRVLVLGVPVFGLMVPLFWS